MPKDKELKIGEILLDYGQEVGDIQLYLGQALSELATASVNLQDAYIGEAKDNLNLYITKMNEHVQAMILHYGILAAYMQVAYDQLEDKDKILEKKMRSLGFEKVEDK